jgi:hypothetical protein
MRMNTGEEPGIIIRVGELVGYLTAPLAVGFEWLRRRVEELGREQSALSEQYHHHEVDAARAYVTRAELREVLEDVIAPLRQSAGRVETKLDEHLMKDRKKGPLGR